MTKNLLLKITFCLFVFGFCLYSYIDKQNKLTSLKIYLPELAKTVDIIKADNNRLQFEIERFENPAHLMELMRSPEYAHLKHPFVDEVLKVQEGVAIKEKEDVHPLIKPSISVTVGSKK